MQVTLMVGVATKGSQFSYTNRIVLVDGDYEVFLDIPLGEVAEKDFAEFANHLKKVANQIYHNHSDKE